MNKSNVVLTGVQYARLNRTPLDKETVMNTYTDLQEHVERVGVTETKTGSFYAGLVTSVVDDEDKEKNGPYYISYSKIGNPGSMVISYIADKIVTESTLQKKLLQWGKIL